LEQEKQKIEQNPVKEPVKEHKHLLDSYIDKAVKSKIIMYNRAEIKEKRLNQSEYKKTQQEEKEKIQKPDRFRGYRI